MSRRDQGIAEMVVVRVEREELLELAELYFGDAILPCCAVCYRDRGEPHRSRCWIARALGLPRDLHGADDHGEERITA